MRLSGSLSGSNGQEICLNFGEAAGKVGGGYSLGAFVTGTARQAIIIGHHSCRGLALKFSKKIKDGIICCFTGIRKVDAYARDRRLSVKKPHIFFGVEKNMDFDIPLLGYRKPAQRMSERRARLGQTAVKQTAQGGQRVNHVVTVHDKDVHRD